MDNEVVQGRVVRTDAIEFPGDLWRAVRRLGSEARARLDGHGRRMEDDPEYRATIEYLTKRLSARPDRLGQAVRAVVASHTRLAKVL